MVSCPSVSHKCYNFFQRHYALDAHTTNFLYTAISPFPIFPFKFSIVFVSFLFAFFDSIFFVPAGWPNFLPASCSLNNQRQRSTNTEAKRQPCRAARNINWCHNKNKCEVLAHCTAILHEFWHSLKWFCTLKNHEILWNMFVIECGFVCVRCGIYDYIYIATDVYLYMT